MTGLMLLVFSFLLGSQGAEQTAVSGPVPLAVTDQGREVDRQRQETVNFFLTNQSSKPIRAYALMITYSDSSGAKSITRTLRSAVQVVMPAVGASYAPGQAWTERASGLPKDAGGSPLSYSLEVDYVRFADGTSWGRDRSRSGPFFDGLEEGARVMRGIIRHKLEREGVDAVRQFLLKP